MFTLAFLSGAMNYAVKRSCKLGLLPGYPQICWSVCIKSEKPSLSLGNQAILHIRKGTVKRSFRWSSGPSGAGCLGKQHLKGARDPFLAREVVFHSLGGKCPCGRRRRVSVPLDMSKVKLKTNSCLPAIKAATLKNLLHMVHTIPQNSPAVETLARSRDHLCTERALQEIG